MNNSKIKKLIISILRLLVFVPLIIILLNAFRLGLGDESFTDLSTYMNNVISMFSNNWLGDFVSFVVDYINPFSSSYTFICSFIVYIGIYELWVSLMVLLYNSISFIVNFANKILEGYVYDKK